MSTIAIIPARGGSKRIPRKNIKDFLGKPIIAYSIEAALASGIFDEVMVSTDDEEIADIALGYGAAVPFFRSPERSTDMAMTAPVLIEVLTEYKKLGRDFECCCCIYPCAPFISAERLREGMALLISKNVDSVLPVARFSYPPMRGLVIDNDKLRMKFPENYNVRSQDLEPIYHDAGQFYCMKTDALLREAKVFCENTLPIELSEMEVQDIDGIDDWKMAELKYKMLHHV
ncbi:MAG: pseudaminic acid cytidylyltransferase [Holosporaceae bacterium]|jgi:N-acylneuraminate cytidylyltransferase|nr:pseudaminic acid cytidylyltransferase [Holosporaceae bacterium]